MSSTGWPQVRLAEEIGVTFAALNRWLNKKAVPRTSARKIIDRIYKEQVGLPPVGKNEISEALRRLDIEKKKHKGMAEMIRDNKSLREDFLLELTYNSNAIEGSTLTKKETEAVIFDQAQIPDRSYVEHLEATNHAAALNLIFDGEFPGRITEGTIKQLHRVIMQGISKDAGKYSRHHRIIRGVDLALPAPENIQEEMDILMRKLNRVRGHVIEHVARMHADLEAIHPFGDGNGRVGRLVMIIQLLNAGHSPCVIENSRKAQYYEVLEFAQKRSDANLIKFICESVEKGYQILRKHRR